MHRFFRSSSELVLGALLMLVAVVLAMIVHAQVTGSPGEDKSWWLFRDDSSGFFALCAVLVAGLQAILFLRQLGLMRETIDTASRAAGKAEKSLHFVEGAWIFSGPQMRSIGDPTGMKMQIINYGKTPASVVEYHMEFSDEQPVGAVATYGTVADKAVFHMGVGDFFFPPHRFERSNGKYAFGFVKYVDVFNNEKISRFCLDISEGEATPAGSAAYNTFDRQS